MFNIFHVGLNFLVRITVLLNVISTPNRHRVCKIFNISEVVTYLVIFGIAVKFDNPTTLAIISSWKFLITIPKFPINFYVVRTICISGVNRLITVSLDSQVVITDNQFTLAAHARRYNHTTQENIKQVNFIPFRKSDITPVCIKNG